MNRRNLMASMLATVPLLETTTMSHAQVSTEAEMTAIWTRWVAFWNGNLGLAEEIIAADYSLHMSPMGGEDISIYSGPAGLAALVGGLHAAIEDLHFDIQVQPLFGDGMIAGRWIASGHYKGGFPGAKAEVGTPVKFAGADFLRIENGKIAEYWLSADQLDLLSQLKAIG